MEYPAALSRPGSGRGCPAGANGVFSKSDDAARLPAALEEIYTEGYYSSAYVSKDLIKAARRNSIASVNIRKAIFILTPSDLIDACFMGNGPNKCIIGACAITYYCFFCR